MSNIVVLNAYHSPEILRHVYEKANGKRPFLEGFKVFREPLNGRLDPAGAKRLLAEKKRLAREQQQLDDEIRQMILKARAKRAQSPHTEYK